MEIHVRIHIGFMNAIIVKALLKILLLDKSGGCLNSAIKLTYHWLETFLHNAYCLQVGNLDVVHIPLKMGIHGNPLHFQMMAAQPQNTPIVRYHRGLNKCIIVCYGKFLAVHGVLKSYLLTYLPLTLYLSKLSIQVWHPCVWSPHHNKAHEDQQSRAIWLDYL